MRSPLAVGLLDLPYQLYSSNASASFVFLQSWRFLTRRMRCYDPRAVVVGAVSEFNGSKDRGATRAIA